MSNYKPSFDPNAALAGWHHYLASKWAVRTYAAIITITTLAMIFYAGYMLGMNRGNDIANRAASSMISAMKEGYCPRK
jgi:hypothetical protein